MFFFTFVGINLNLQVMKKILLYILLTSSFIANAQFWTEKATGFTTPGRTLNCIAIANSSVIWANEYDSTTEDYTLKGFTRSTDGGNTWTPGSINLGAATNELGISSITAISATTAWISAFPDTAGTIQVGGIWKTIDGGTTWTKQPTALFNSSDSFPNFVYFWDANNGVAQGDPESGEFEVYTTTDGGTTWTRVPAANIPDPSPIGGEFSYFNRYSVSGNTIWFGTDKGRIYKSTDKGLNWTVTQTPSLDFKLDRFTFSDTNKGLLMRYNIPSTALFKTIDGGDTWNPIPTTGFFRSEMAYIPGTSIVISSGSYISDYGSTYSIDDGATWIGIDDVSHGVLAFLNSSFGFSAGMNTNTTTGGIFKFTGIPLKNTSFDVKNQVSAYPNPTNGILKLDSGISLIKEAAVFDLLGRQVYSCKFSGLNNVTLDLKSLQTGTYVLKVTSDAGKTENIKIMKN
jgi:photosystem II stability/assembly factor-like uncharacterized protein